MLRGRALPGDGSLVGGIPTLGLVNYYPGAGYYLGVGHTQGSPRGNSFPGVGYSQGYPRNASLLGVGYYLVVEH